MLSLTLNDKEVIRIASNIYLKVYKDKYGHYRIIFDAPRDVIIKRIDADSDEAKAIGFTGEKSIRKNKNH